jgi:hypothetical protein
MQEESTVSAPPHLSLEEKVRYRPLPEYTLVSHSELPPIMETFLCSICVSAEITVEDHEVIVRLNLPSRILSVPSWALPLEAFCHGKQDKYPINRSPPVDKTSRNRMKHSLSHHHDQPKGYPNPPSPSSR